MIRLACLVIVVAGAVAIPSAATAQSSAGDSVTGSLLLNPPDSSPDDTTRYFFDVRSGPSGESPSGTVTLRGRFITDPGAVTCLAVRGNRASIGVSFTGGGFVEPSGSVVFVDDLGGEGQDTIARSVFVGPSTGPAVCPTELPEGVTRPLGPTYPDPLFDGNVAIADAPSLPTTKEQCKDDGWRDYGTTFANQGDCVSYVTRQARQECSFIRAAHGRPAFRAWYGTGVYHRDAMRRCVRLRSRE